MALSDQLRSISKGIRAQADNSQAQGNAQSAMQTQQAIKQPVPQANLKQAGSQIAAQATASQGQAGLSAQKSENAMDQQLGQQAVAQTGQNNNQSLANQQQLNSKQISDLQREGKLRQNSEKLRSAKKLTDMELKSQSRMLSKGLAVDNSISFLTQKQREDLANISSATKNMLFDQRLVFNNSENQRKFTNSQQLADYAVSQAESKQDLEQKFSQMERASQMEMSALKHAHSMITNKMKDEFQRAEKQKDYAMLKRLSQMKIDMEKKIARKKAKAAANKSMIVGAFTVAGAVVGGIYGGPAGAAAGASLGSAGGTAVAGQVE